MQIDWWTLALQAINFLVLVWLLWRFLYRPVRKVIEERKELAERAFGEATKAKDEADAARQSFEQDRLQLSQERQEMLKTVHQDLDAERAKIVEAARREAAQLIDSANANIEKERHTAIAEIREQVTELAVDMASTLLRKLGSESLNDTFLQKIDAHIENLPEDERARLKTDLDADGAHLTVVTATALDADAQDRWRTRLGNRLDRSHMTEFTVDPSIIGGAELRFPHAVLKFTWADQLEKAKGIMTSNDAAS
jgi:F-type H+-transporting ATPase subunit b